MIELNPLERKSVHRLSDGTRTLAAQYLSGQFRQELQMPDFSIDDLDLPENISPIERHAMMATLIAKQTPLIFRPEEKIAGSAPLIPAMMHQVPGMKGRYSISHTTADFGDAIRKGLSGLERELHNYSNETQEEANFRNALLQVIAAMRIWVTRYADLCRRHSDSSNTENINAILKTLQNVPENPPSDFREALQSFWLFFEFQRLCGNWSGLGRFDQILGTYLENDLQTGKIQLDEARELIAHFWIKGTEWCYGLRKYNPGEPGSGDAQHYQNIILGGVDEDGLNIENSVTYLVLDVIEELHISDYPVAVRINRQTSQKLLRRIADVQLLGGGIVSIYNEDVVMNGLRQMGFPKKEIVNFTNDGCWEVIFPGKTAFSYTPFDLLQVFQQALFSPNIPESFDKLYQSYLECLRQYVKDWRQTVFNRHYTESTDPVTGKKVFKHFDPAPEAVLSLVMPSCRQSGRPYYNLGTSYTINALHAGGLPDVANSLLAIKKKIFEEHRLPLSELVKILKDNWKDNELLRQEFANSILYYGNDDDDADAMTKMVFDDYAKIVAASEPIPGVLTPAGISTFGREIEFAPYRKATAFGKYAGEYLAPNMSPTPGTEKNALTAVLNSYCKMDFSGTPNGCPLDLRLSAGMRKLPNAPDILIALFKAFLEQGGFYLQLDTVDAATLRAAQKDPDRFPNLVVRISGWSARFASLSKEWQDMIINRTELEA